MAEAKVVSLGGHAYLVIEALHRMQSFKESREDTERCIMPQSFQAVTDTFRHNNKNLAAIARAYALAERLLATPAVGSGFETVYLWCYLIISKQKIYYLQIFN